MLATIQRYSVFLIVLMLLVSPANGKNTEGPLEAEVGSCEECAGKTDTGVLYGALDSVSLKASMLQLVTNNGTKVVSFDDNTILSGAKDFNALVPGLNIQIDYLKQEGIPLAIGLDIVASEPDVLEDNQIGAKALQKILSSDTEISLIDARSERSYDKEHIPGAISIYHGVFAQHTDKLPANKEQLIVYYCDGTS